MSELDDLILAEGWWGSVQYAVRSSGKSEAKSWFEKQKPKVQSQFDHLFRRIAQTGLISNKELFRKLKDGIFEFKRGGNRIACFRVENTWFLTHRFPKASDKNLPKQISRARNIMHEHMERNKNEP